jgi:hypothetical protein
MLSWYRRARWLALGAIAGFACDYDDTAEALLLPPMVVGMAVISWFALSNAVGVGGAVGYLLVVVAAGFGIMFSIMAVLLLGATAVYATQTTELPAGEEVVTRE